jgi:hypothetical protein
MKKILVLLLILTLLATSSAFASVVIPQIVIPTPIVIDPIITIPLMPSFTNTSSLYNEPLYRLYHDDWEVHTYTSSESERTALLANGWTDDGIIAYVSPIKLENTKLLYRFKLFGRLTRLSNDYSLVDLGWTLSGAVGYVPTDDASGYAKVHESVKQLDDGDMLWNSDYYYGSDYITMGPYITIPSVPHGYNWTSAGVIDMWDSPSQLQALQVEDVPSNLTGSQTYEINWETLRSGGYVKLTYSTDLGETWTTIAENVQQSGTTDSYDWTVPNITNSEMQLRLLWSQYANGGSVVWDTSNTFTTTQNSGGLIFIPILPPVEMITFSPTAPTNLTASTTPLMQQISLYWTDNAGTETGYVVERKTEGGLYATVGTVGINATGFVDTTIAEGVPYTYRVKATGLLADSTYSNEVEETYNLLFMPLIPEGFIPPEAPNTPTNAQASFTDSSESEVLIEWDAPSGTFAGYNVERDAGMGWINIGSTTDEDLNYMDTDLLSLSGEVSYRIRSFNGPFSSSPSNTVSVIFTEDTSGLVMDGSQSGWAESELQNAYDNGLTYPGVMNNFGQNITREEFCTIAVKLYEKLSGMPAVSGADPFDDTDNPNILKAYNLGIVYGISANEFAPINNITRQEMCVMIYRALDSAGFNITVDPAASFGFGDKNSIASWAMDQVKFCHQNGIMSGTSTTTIAPLLNTPREQAIALINRAFNTFNP